MRCVPESYIVVVINCDVQAYFRNNYRANYYISILIYKLLERN